MTLGKIKSNKQLSTEWNEISTSAHIARGLYYLQEVCPILTALCISFRSVLASLRQTEEGRVNTGNYLAL